MLKLVSINDHMYDLEELEHKYPGASYKSIVDTITAEQQRVLPRLLLPFKKYFPALDILCYGV